MKRTTVPCYQYQIYFRFVQFYYSNKVVLGLENGSERSKINTAKMASIFNRKC